MAPHTLTLRVRSEAKTRRHTLRPPNNVKRRPTRHDWEILRPTITKLWYCDNQSLSVVIQILGQQFPFLVTPKPLKQKLDEWHLVKKLNADDAADISAAYSRMLTFNQRGHLLLRGRLESVHRVHQYEKRVTRSHRSCDQSLPLERLTNVITLMGYTNLRPEPLRGLLHEFESLIRETQLILQRARRTILCKPGNVSLDWCCATSETYAWGCQFQLYIWEGLRAFREERMQWAGICWQFAFMQLERLSWLPDLDTWTIFIRSCIRLARFGAQEVGQALLRKLSWLHDKLPVSAPHRAFLDALINLPYADLVSGGSLLLEAKLRIVETLWSTASTTCTKYQAELAEECFYIGSNTCNVVTCEESLPELPSILQIWQQVEKDESRITQMVLDEDLPGAQSLVQKAVDQLEMISDDYGEDVLFQTLSSRLWAMLGHFQFFQDDQALNAQKSYTNALSLNEKCLVEHSKWALEIPHMHRTWYILRWIAKNAPTEALYSEVACDRKMNEIEADLRRILTVWSNSRLGSQDGRQLLDKLLDQAQCSESIATKQKPKHPPNLDKQRDTYKAGQLSVRAEYVSKRTKTITKPKQEPKPSRSSLQDKNASRIPHSPMYPSKPVTPWQ